MRRLTQPRTATRPLAVRLKHDSWLGGLGLAGVDEGGGLEEGGEVEVAGVAEVVQVGEQLDERCLEAVGVAVADVAVQVEGLGGVGGAVGVGLAGLGGACGGVLHLEAHLVPYVVPVLAGGTAVGVGGWWVGVWVMAGP